MKDFLSEERIMFWTIFSLLLWGAKLAMFVFAGGLCYNVIVSLLNRTKGQY